MKGGHAMSSARRSIPVYQVDAFSERPFKGNPAAVCLLDSPLDDEIMRSIAGEMNLSETAFVLSDEDRPLAESRRFHLRWFTPEVEVPLCGHATLATAFVLFNEVGLSSEVLTFRTLSGELFARRAPGGVTLDFPADPPLPFEAPKDLLEALGIPKVLEARRGVRNAMLLIRVDDEKTVRALQPDFRAMRSLKYEVRIDEGVIVTAVGKPPYDFISRFFDPWEGIDEDPVTGSAHTLLAPYWSEILGKGELLAYQASQRGGTLALKLTEGGKVDITGKAALVLKGELTF